MTFEQAPPYLAPHVETATWIDRFSDDALQLPESKDESYSHDIMMDDIRREIQEQDLRARRTNRKKKEVSPENKNSAFRGRNHSLVDQVIINAKSDDVLHEDLVQELREEFKAEIEHPPRGKSRNSGKRAALRLDHSTESRAQMEVNKREDVWNTIDSFMIDEGESDSKDFPAIESCCSNLLEEVSTDVPERNHGEQSKDKSIKTKSGKTSPDLIIPPIHFKSYQDDDINLLLHATDRTILRIRVKSSVKETVMTMPVSMMVKRDLEMRQVAADCNITPSIWNGSKLYVKWKEFHQQAMKNRKPNTSKNTDIELVLDPEYGCANSNNSQNLRWEPWLTRTIQHYYETGKLQIPNSTVGSDILLAIEYFGILYSQGQLVFSSMEAFQRVKAWSLYFTHRTEIGHWVTERMLQEHDKHCYYFFTSPNPKASLPSNTFYVGNSQAEVLEGALVLDNSRKVTNPSCVIIHKFFNNDGAVDSVHRIDEAMRNDFSTYLQNMMPGICVNFSPETVTRKVPNSNKVHQFSRAVLFIYASEDPRPVVDDNTSKSDIQSASDISRTVDVVQRKFDDNEGEGTEQRREIYAAHQPSYQQDRPSTGSTKFSADHIYGDLEAKQFTSSSYPMANRRPEPVEADIMIHKDVVHAAVEEHQAAKKQALQYKLEVEDDISSIFFEELKAGQSELSVATGEMITSCDFMLGAYDLFKDEVTNTCNAGDARKPTTTVNHRGHYNPYGVSSYQSLSPGGVLSDEASKDSLQLIMERPLGAYLPKRTPERKSSAEHTAQSPYSVEDFPVVKEWLSLQEHSQPSLPTSKRLPTNVHQLPTATAPQVNKPHARDNRQQRVAQDRVIVPEKPKIQNEVPRKQERREDAEPKVTKQQQQQQQQQSQGPAKGMVRGGASKSKTPHARDKRQQKEKHAVMDKTIVIMDSKALREKAREEHARQEQQYMAIRDQFLKNQKSTEVSSARLNHDGRRQKTTSHHDQNAGSTAKTATKNVWKLPKGLLLNWRLNSSSSSADSSTSDYPILFEEGQNNMRYT